eukprot:COSAG06_NODE_51326_length_313_cov_0.602804_2_plen_52_part_01
MRLDLYCWEIYGFIPSGKGKNAVKDAIRCMNLEQASNKAKERPTEEIFADAT